MFFVDFLLYSVNMRVLFFFICLFFLLRAVTLTHAAETSERITQFDVITLINPNGTVAVKETIAYDSGSEKKHALFRTIPTRYERNEKKYEILISEIAVKDTNGADQSFEVQEVNGDIRIRINETSPTMVIYYRVANAIFFDKEKDELIWNVIGRDWGIPIARAQFMTIFPYAVDRRDVRVHCFAGVFGSNISCAKGSFRTTNGTLTDAVIMEHSELSKNDTMIARVTFPKGLVIEHTTLETFLFQIKKYWMALIAVFSSVAAGIYMVKKRRI